MKKFTKNEKEKLNLQTQKKLDNSSFPCFYSWIKTFNVKTPIIN